MPDPNSIHQGLFFQRSLISFFRLEVSFFRGFTLSFTPAKQPRNNNIHKRAITATPNCQPSRVLTAPPPVLLNTFTNGSISARATRLPRNAKAILKEASLFLSFGSAD